MKFFLPVLGVTVAVLVGITKLRTRSSEDVWHEATSR